MSLHWFKFFAGDYMSSPFVQALDPEQEFWYLRLIIASAISLPRGCLPLANGKLWRIAKAPSLEHFEKHCDQILAKFTRDEVGGFYRVPKVANQLITNGDLSSKRAEAGKKGAAKRWDGHGNLPSGEMANAIKIGGNLLVDSDLDSETTKSELFSSDEPQEPSSKKRQPTEVGSRLAGHLKGLILQNNPKARISEKQERDWAFEVDRMIKLDSRTEQEIAALIAWSQQDSFWSANILSMQKLRKQFDALTIKRNRGQEKPQSVIATHDYIPASVRMRQKIDAESKANGLAGAL